MVKGRAMPEQIPYDRLMELRNRVLIYVLERGAGQPKGYVPLDEMKRELDLQRDEYRAVYLNLHQAGLAHTNATNTAIYLTDAGRLEAERMKAGDRPGTGSMHIDARYSVVQIAGAGSTQTASLSIDQQRVLTLVEEIEQKLPNLPLSPAQRDEATSLADALRKAVRELPAAGARAIGAALAALLTGAGSDLGHRLMEALQIGPSN